MGNLTDTEGQNGGPLLDGVSLDSLILMEKEERDTYARIYTFLLCDGHLTWSFPITLLS